MSASPGLTAEHPLPRNLPRLTALRAPAALAVFVYHIGHETPWVETTRLIRTGYTGVALFFVLSGFVLMWSTAPGRSAREFWLRRVARIYPAHLLTAVVALLLPGLLYAPTIGSVAANLTLVQAWFGSWDIAFSLNGVSWSLSCEAFFYLVAPFVFARVSRMPTSRALMVLGAWWVVAAAASALAVMLGGGDGDIRAYTNPAVRSGEFAVGIACAVAVGAGWRPRIGVITAVILAGVAYAAIDHLQLPQTWSSIALTPFFALVLVAAATADVRGRRGPLRHPVLVRAGEVSFAFYLVHEIVIRNLVLAVGTGGSPGRDLATVGAALAISIVLALGLHHGWELPVQRALLKRWIRRRPAAAEASRPA